MRRAVNYPIQGSSQDIIKKACVVNFEQLNQAPIILVHDEVIYELHESVLKGQQKMTGVSTGHPKIIVDNMENVWKLRVPLKVSWKISDCWEK